MKRRQKGQKRNIRVPQQLTSSPLRQPHCPPPCGKLAAPTRADAVAIHDAIAGRLQGSGNVRYYECEQTFGVWHWTRRMRWEK